MPDRRLTRGIAAAARAVAVTAVGVISLWTLYLARDALLMKSRREAGVSAGVYSLAPS